MSFVVQENLEVALSLFRDYNKPLSCFVYCFLVFARKLHQMVKGLKSNLKPVLKCCQIIRGAGRAPFRGEKRLDKEEEDEITQEEKRAITKNELRYNMMI